jgi:hypothetical protein
MPFTVIGVIGGRVSKALDSVPDPKDKIALPEHALDLQSQHVMAQLDAQSKQLCAADDSDKSGHPLWSARAFLF